MFTERLNKIITIRKGRTHPHTRLMMRAVEWQQAVWALTTTSTKIVRLNCRTQALLSLSVNELMLDTRSRWDEKTAEDRRKNPIKIKKRWSWLSRVLSRWLSLSRNRFHFLRAPSTHPLGRRRTTFWKWKKTFCLCRTLPRPENFNLLQLPLMSSLSAFAFAVV